MAKRKFVSSKKNAPSRAISSKEAALHGRTAAGGDADSPDSAASSDGEDSSTPVSSEDERDQEEDEDIDDDDLDAAPDATSQPVAVEVMPSSVGRGKQLRFPTVISRGKESRVLPADGDASDANDSDDESLLSIGDSDDEDGTRGVSAMEIEEEPSVPTPVDTPNPASWDHKSSKPASSSKTVQQDAPSYPIKAVRARKRHRPDSEYYKQMSTYVRDCLLSVRHAGSSDAPADAFRDDASPRHDEFRRRLAAGNVERVTWKEPPPAESSAGGTRREQPADAVSSRSSKPSKSDKSSKHSASSRSSKSSKSSKPSSSSKTSPPEAKVADASKPSSSSNGSTKNVTPPPTQASAPVAPSAPAMCEVCKKKLSGEAPKEEELERAVKKEKDVKKEPPAADPKQPPKEVKKEVPPPAPVAPGSFAIPFTGGKDVQKMRLEATKVMDEARRLKHEGNRRGSSERSTEGQRTQGKYYLRSGAKFFEYALKLQEVKAAYQEQNDAQHARSFGEMSVTTLTQTSSLIESTIHSFQSAGDVRLAALGCKMASVVHLTIYRLQHRKLVSFYSEVFTPTRSPESRENGLTPPIDPNSSLSSTSSKDTAMRKHLLKEMEHTLRGFEMWRRYETCKVSVLPRVTNPVVLDLAVFCEDLEAELSRS
ncbi:hypothetical protein BBJ28_00016525 [Nothophytophthora sp. Chile5]|nr:hypothetical protein BBJ28_00016525 [Nothophytophthora sp. Chile5]